MAPLRPFSFVLVMMMVLLLGEVTLTLGSEVRGKRSDDGGPLEVVVQQLSQQMTSVTAQLTQLNAELTSLKAKTNTLDTTVAFHAWGSTNPIQAISHGTLIFDHVTTNIGNAYDATTGVFSAPVAGLYTFLATVMERNLSGYVAAGIFVDGVLQCKTISDNRNGANYDQSPSHVVVHLHAGSKVALVNTEPIAAEYFSDLGAPYTSFSGFLVKAD